MDRVPLTRLQRLPFFFGWVIVAVAFVTMAVSVTARTAFSLLMPPLINRIDLQKRIQNPAKQRLAAKVSEVLAFDPNAVRLHGQKRHDFFI